MKTIYKTGNGQTAELEVSSAVATLLADFAREDRNAARKERQRKEVSIEAMYEEMGFELTDTAVDIETEYINNEEKDSLLAAVSALSDKQRLLIRLRYCEKKTESEIAVILRVNQSNIHRQLETIHKELRKYFEKLL